jgi:hypothetical protein
MIAVPSIGIALRIPTMARVGTTRGSVGVDRSFLAEVSFDDRAAFGCCKRPS